MKVGIVGAGRIGATLASHLKLAGHHVFLSNSRGPESIQDKADAAGVVAVYATDAVRDVDVVIVSVPFGSIPDLKELIAKAPAGAVIIDTSNYFPFRDDAFAGDTTESQWVSAQLNRPVQKAWNSVLAGSLANKGLPKGAVGRIALPVAGDDPRSKQVALELVEDTGFDAVDAGTLEASWRQEPGNPAYCTDLSIADLHKALARADRSKAGARRDLVAQKVTSAREDYTNEDILALSRSVYNT